jgi:hypothetical protein
MVAQRAKLFVAISALFAEYDLNDFIMMLVAENMKKLVAFVQLVGKQKLFHLMILWNKLSVLNRFFLAMVVSLYYVHNFLMHGSVFVVKRLFRGKNA